MHLKNIKIGILGGTFDPIHNGHLWSAQSICDMLALAQVIFIPAYIPPHKIGQKYAPAQDRYAMTALAVQKFPKFTVSDMEIQRNQVSYTYDTIVELHKKYPQAELYFLIGADTVTQLHKWHRIKELLQLVTFVAADRPGYHKVLQEAEKQLGIIARERIMLLNTPEHNISSTEIRARIKAGNSLDTLVPEEVEKYIYTHGLYQETTEN